MYSSSEMLNLVADAVFPRIRSAEERTGSKSFWFWVCVLVAVLSLRVSFYRSMVPAGLWFAVLFAVLLLVGASVLTSSPFILYNAEIIGTRSLLRSSYIRSLLAMSRFSCSSKRLSS